MSRKVKTQAIVLKKRRLLNKDLQVCLFSQELGKVNVFAKGVRKISSRRLPHLQTGNLVQILIYKHDEKMYLQETSLVSAFSKIKKDPKKISFLYLMFHVLDRLLPENQKEQEIYKIAKTFLIDLSEREFFNEKKLEEYLSKTLMMLGFIKEKGNLVHLHQFIEDLTGEKLPFLVI